MARLYYFGSKGYFYIVKHVHNYWGLQYHRTTDLQTNANGETVDIHRSVANFLPDGLALALRPKNQPRVDSLSGRWSLLLEISTW